MTSDPRGQRLGEFEIVRELGRGGMGVVYEAIQTSLGRRVALKVLGQSFGLTPKSVDRFRREAAAAAKLHHTNIVPVYATGEVDGTHYYAMELIDGPSLDDVIVRESGGPAAEVPNDQTIDYAATVAYVPDLSEPAPEPTKTQRVVQRSLTPERYDRAAKMIAEVADALYHAHQNGVMHRDIKPSNLLLSADGRLSITDFGLARMDEQPSVTATGEFVGTPAYVSPEQIAGGRAPIDHRADIYSLGATLYHLLALQPPFTADRLDKLLAMVAQKEPPTPRSIDPKIPRDLETICMKCLEKDPNRRYSTAKELADDLRRFVNRFAISAKRVGPITRIKKWIVRNPVIAGAGVVILLALCFASFFAWQSSQDRARLRVEQRQAAVDNAILVALSGESQPALEAITAAESKGVEPAMLNVLRGLVEIHRGRPKDAIVLLTHAERQAPDSVAVKAMMTKAYLETGQDEKFDELYTQLESVTPRTPEDQLFLGMIQGELDPFVGLQTLDAMPARYRQAPVVRLARTMAQIGVAQQTGKLDDAERAVDDIRRIDLPDNSWALGCSVLANVTLAHAYGQDPRTDAAWKQAERDTVKLAAYRDNPNSIFRRCYYFFAHGDDDMMLETIAQARRDRVEVLPDLANMELSILYKRKRFDDCLKILEGTSNEGRASYQLFQHAIVLATLGRYADADKALDNAVSECKRGIVPALLPAYYQLLGPIYRDKSKLVALKLREREHDLLSNVYNGWYHHLLAFQAGLIDDAELLQKAADNQFNLCEAHFYIGIRQLAAGNRPAAKACFQRSTATGVYLFFEYLWSRALLAHVDDPTWLADVTASTDKPAAGQR